MSVILSRFVKDIARLTSMLRLLRVSYPLFTGVGAWLHAWRTEEAPCWFLSEQEKLADVTVLY